MESVGIYLGVYWDRHRVLKIGSISDNYEEALIDLDVSNLYMDRDIEGFRVIKMELAVSGIQRADPDIYFACMRYPEGDGWNWVLSAETYETCEEEARNLSPADDVEFCVIGVCLPTVNEIHDDRLVFRDKWLSRAYARAEL